MGAEKHQPDDKLQSEGRRENAAQPLNDAPDRGGAERYPPTGKDDSVSGEPRNFEAPQNPQPRQGAGDGGPDPSVNQGHMGPGGDPAEGKR